MNKSSWKKKIKQAAIAAKTYKPFFDSAIDTLAGIMELRDKAQTAFEESGGETVIEHTNKGGQTNLVKNPALVLILECNQQALAYWRDLGLTPKGLKAIDEKAMKATKRSGLAEALKELSAND